MSKIEKPRVPGFLKFMVWRAYHILKRELGRRPYSSEVLAEVRRATERVVTRNQVICRMSVLKSCKKHRPDGGWSADASPERYVQYRVPDLVDMLQ